MSVALGRTFLSVACLFAALQLPAAADPPALVRRSYLQQGTPSSMVVRWRTDLASESVFRYGPAPDDLSTTLTIAGPTTEHEVKVTGLEPFSRHYYSVGTETETLEGGDDDHFFVTSPVHGNTSSIRIWVLGDSGLNNTIAHAVRDAYVNFVAGQPADVWLMLGDNAYPNGTDAEHTDAIFNNFPAILRKTVLWPTPGNHDLVIADSPTQTGPYYEAFTLPALGEAGGAPSGTEAYYSYDYGNIHFISLDSHDSDGSVGGAMYDWLLADLVSTSQDWIIAYWHYAPYSKGSRDSDTQFRMIRMRENFLPLLEEHGVDLVLAGHSHVYERSMLIDGHYGTSDSFDASHVVDGGDGDPAGDGAYAKPVLGPATHDGTVYLVLGCSASPQAGQGLDHPVMVRGFELVSGSTVIDVNGGQLDAYFISGGGSVLDRFQITKGPLPVPALGAWAIVVLVGAVMGATFGLLRKRSTAKI